MPCRPPSAYGFGRNKSDLDLVGRVGMLVSAQSLATVLTGITSFENEI